MSHPRERPWRRQLIIAALILLPGIIHVRWSGDVLRARGKDNLLLGTSTRPGTTRVPHFLLSPAIVRAHEDAIPDTMVRDVELRRLRGGARFYVIRKTNGNTRWQVIVGEEGDLREKSRSDRISLKALPNRLVPEPPEPGTMVFCTWETSQGDSVFFSFAGITTSGILLEWKQAGFTRTEGDGTG